MTSLLLVLRALLVAATALSISLGCSALRRRRPKAALWWMLAAAALTVGSFRVVAPPAKLDMHQAQTSRPV